MPAYVEKFEEAFFIYSFRFPLITVNPQSQLQQPVKIQGDADFVWRGYMTGQASAALDDWTAGLPIAAGVGAPGYRLKPYLPDSRGIFNTAGVFSQINEGPNVAFGDGRVPFPMAPEVLLSKNSTLFLDIVSNLGALNYAVMFDLRGVKLLEKGTRYQIDRTKQYDTEPYSYWVHLLNPTQLVAGQRFVGTQALKLDSDSEFLLYSIEATPNLAPLQFQFYGPEGELTSANVTNGVSLPGLISLSSIAGDPVFPGVICPPMAYPAGGRIAYDYVVPAAGIAAPDGWIRFRGAKLYAK